MSEEIPFHQILATPFPWDWRSTLNGECIVCELKMSKRAKRCQRMWGVKGEKVFNALASNLCRFSEEKKEKRKCDTPRLVPLYCPACFQEQKMKQQQTLVCVSSPHLSYPRHVCQSSGERTFILHNTFFSLLARTEPDATISLTKTPSSKTETWQ